MDGLKNKLAKLIKIYVTFFKIGAISFGGGYAMLPVIEREIVTKNHWVDKKKMTDIFAVAGSLPGAIALNASTFTGYAVAKVPGAVIALIGNLTPSFFIVIVLSKLLIRFGDLQAVDSALRGIAPVVGALILYASYKIAKRTVIDRSTLVIAAVTVLLMALCTWLEIAIPFLAIIIAGALAGWTLIRVRTILHAKNKYEGENE